MLGFFGFVAFVGLAGGGVWYWLNRMKVDSSLIQQDIDSRYDEIHAKYREEIEKRKVKQEANTLAESTGYQRVVYSGDKVYNANASIKTANTKPVANNEVQETRSSTTTNSDVGTTIAAGLAGAAIGAALSGAFSSRSDDTPSRSSSSDDNYSGGSSGGGGYTSSWSSDSSPSSSSGDGGGGGD